MLLVAEILFAIWLFKAQSSPERTAAGILMALVFISLMMFVSKMNRTPAKKNANSSELIE
jgi:ABC-type thiamin/hydroxymethylpyrimidine transport system permease subunit